MSGAIARTRATTRVVKRFRSLEVGTLRCMDVACADIYLRHASHAEPVLYCRAGDSVATDHLYGLAEAGVQHVYVTVGDFDSLGPKLLGTVKSFINRETIPAAERFGMLQLAASLEIEHAAQLLDCGKFIDVAREVGRQIVGLLNTSVVLPHDMFRIARHDYSTFTHITNVACFAVILLERLGYCGREDFDRVATGAILHDVGKRFIPAAILTKRGKLESHERDIIESHPLRGYEQLYGRPGIDFDQLMMVYRHHERQDGSGYPVKILAEEIHPWAQALAVVDVFEAMTGRRPYRRPSPAAEVLSYLESQAGPHFKPEIVACWSSAMRET